MDDGRLNSRPIGVFDSGLGGLTAVRELRRLLPGEDIVYFGDTGRVPYGSRGTDTIVQYAKQDIAFLLEQKVKFILAACGTDASEPSADPNASASPAASVGPADVPDVEVSASLNFGTGSSTGTYYGFGSTFATYISNNTGVKITAVTSDGSQANLEMVDAGRQQLGFVQSDVMSYAYNGTRLFVDADGNPAPLTNFTTLAALYMEQVQIVTLDPNIKTVADLEGKYVSIGATGSGVYFNSIDVLCAYGLTEEDINPCLLYTSRCV